MKVQNMTLYNGNNAKTGMLSMNSVLGSKYFSKSKYGSLGRSSAINNSNNSNANSGLYTSSSGTKKK
jgi:hypothetical protein